MDKLEYALRTIENCDLCFGKGVFYYGNGEDYEFENCECNPHELIFDYDGAVIWDNGTLFTTAEAN